MFRPFCTSSFVYWKALRSERGKEKKGKEERKGGLLV